MGNEKQFHCVGCSSMYPGREAQMVFRTGFYQVSYPLGFCKGCALEVDRAQAEESSDSTGYVLNEGRHSQSGYRFMSA